MSVTSNRQIVGTFDGDVVTTFALHAAENTAGPGSESQVTLSSGNNTVSVPTGATAVTVVKSPTNTVAMTLKGVAGDTGVALHLTDPDSISLGSAVTSFVLNAASTVAVRLIWT